MTGAGAWRPLVSVVLPTHDRPDRLAGALASVLAQSYDHLEVIVVDDASCSPVRPVVEGVAGDDTRVRLIETTEPSGAARARNTALATCSGELVAFLDDDDRWEPDKTRLQVEFLDAHPDVGVVSCDYVVIDESSRRGVVRYRGPAAFSAEQVQWMNFPGSFSFVMVRRALVGDELCLDERFPSVEDWDLWLRCLRRTAAGVVRQPLCRHVAHGGPRLSRPASERQGHELFLRKHGPTLPPACRAYLESHLHMYDGTGWAHRGAVARALVTRSPRVSSLLVLEQMARQAGRVLQDPGLVARAMARAVGGDGHPGAAVAVGLGAAR